MLEELEKRIQEAVERRVFFDANEFPWVREVEAQWPQMRKELDRLLTAIEVLPGFEEIQVEQKQVTDDKRWKIFPLFAYGNWLDDNARRCPETARVVRMIPGLQAAMFSVLQAHKDIPPHRGVYSGVLRYHLGLKIPQPETQCGICVDGIRAYWQEGKSLIFDDRHMHEAWNRSDEDRIVLFVDFTRPLPDSLARLNEAALADIGTSPFICNAIERWRQWEVTHGSKLDEILGRGVG